MTVPTTTVTTAHTAMLMTRLVMPVVPSAAPRRGTALEDHAHVGVGQGLPHDLGLEPSHVDQPP